MREIKFRNWNGNKMEYFDLEELYSEDLGTPGDLLMGSDYLSGELMQYTGLKDKKGKEIYEGDVIEYDFAPCGKQVGEFTFDEGMYFIKGTGKWRPLKCKIIGNIHENPELLKGGG